MANINRVFLAGNLTRDPQLKFVGSERAVANFGIAVNRRYKGSDGSQKEETTFVDVEAWGRTAELTGQYLVKGSSCMIEGRLKLDTWEKDGQKHSKLRVVADSVQFLDSKRTGDRQAAPGAPAAEGEGEPVGAAAPAAARPTPPPAAGGDDEPPF